MRGEWRPAPGEWLQSQEAPANGGLIDPARGVDSVAIDALAGGSAHIRKSTLHLDGTKEAAEKDFGSVGAFRRPGHSAVALVGPNRSGFALPPTRYSPWLSTALNSVVYLCVSYPRRVRRAC